MIPRESPIKIGTLAKLSNLFIDFGHLQGRVSRGAMVALRKIDLGRSVVQGRVPAPPPLARSGVIGPGARSIASGAFAAAPPVALGGNELPLETACSLPSHAERKSPRARAPRLT